MKNLIKKLFCKHKKKIEIYRFYQDRFMKYTIHFELFGKKMKTTVDARSIEDAKQQVRNKIVFHKIQPEENIDFLKNIFNIK